MKGYFCIAFYNDMPNPKMRARYLVQDASIDTLAQLHSLYSMSISGGPDGADAKQLSATSKKGDVAVVSAAECIFAGSFL